MDDLISRQSVNDAMDRTCDLVCEYSKEQRYTMCGACPLGCAFDAVADVPSAQHEITEWRKWSCILNERSAFKHDVADAPTIEPQQWIPCEGRCPEKSGDYLVTDDCKNIYVNEWHCLLHKWQYDDSRIMAWMPLPEPYREGGES